MSKNSLDNFFRDKFKDFRSEPEDHVWESISDSLDKKGKKRRLLPVWWRAAGVAAVLLLALFFFWPESEVPETQITDSETEVSVPESRDESSPGISDDAGQDQLVSSPDPELPGGAGSVENDRASDLERNPSKSSPAAVPQRLAERDAQTEVSGSRQDEAAFAANRQETEAENLNETQFSGQASEAVAVAEDRDQDNTANRTTENIATEALVLDTEESVQNPETEVAETEVATESEKKSIYDEIAAREAAEIATADQTAERWTVGPSIAPVYFSSFGDGSPIHSNFVSNSKTGNLNMSYGVGVSYSVGKKLKLRSGVHRVDYGYDTNDITFSSSLVASTNNQISNITYSATSKNLVVQSASGTDITETPTATDIIAPTPSRDGTMVQRFGYLEVPLELNYAILNKKFGINVVGGVSSLFLVNNSVTLESGGSTTEMGSANNINSLNFSTNIGLGLNYEFAPKFNLHLEPMFKYQLNTFSTSEGNFQPYSLGLYSGVSYRF